MSVASVGYVPVSMPIPIDVHGGQGQAQVQTVRRPNMALNKPEDKPEPEKKKPNVIHSTAADLQQISLVFNKKLQFVIDHNSNEVIVKVIDKETDKVVRELPPEELQRLHTNLKETIGFLFDERV